MASYQDLFDLRRNQELLDKVTVAVIVATETIYASCPSLGRCSKDISESLPPGSNMFACAYIFRGF